MKINRVHVVVGIFLVLIPLTGVTQGFKNWSSILAGVVILYFAMRSIHSEITKRQSRHRRSDSFVESRPRDFSSRIKQASFDKDKKPLENKQSVESEEKGDIQESNPHSLE